MTTWAAIFDWDGVIIDSSRQHEESWNRLARNEGRTLPVGHFKRGFGMKNERIIPEILGWTDDADTIRRLSEKKERLYREVVRETGVEPLPGVKAWLKKLRARGVPCAIASSTHRLNITTSLELTGLTDYFEGVVSAEDVIHGKPAPDVFLAAADVVKAAPGRCVVFEDSPVGIQAARAAGMKTIGVASTRPAAALRDADKVVSRLDELNADELAGGF